MLDQRSTEQFWNHIYTEQKTIVLPDSDNAILQAATAHFGDLAGKSLLDLGCGDGATSLFFARQGANVTAIDISETAIQKLAQFCQENQIENIYPVKCSAFEIHQFGEFDYVFGSMILHHLEPFSEFAKILRQTVALDGKAFFYENNAYSNLLIWFRKNLIGKFGIPKYGDEDEFPLMPMEVDMLRHYFQVKVFYPELVFFQLISTYLLRGQLQFFTNWLDQAFYQFSAFHRYSYRQYLLLD